MKVRRGAYVTEVSEQDLREVYDLLALLESDAAGEVCTRATDADLHALAQMHAQLEQAADPVRGSRERFFEINEAFHLRLLDLAGNRWRKQIVTDLRKVMKLNRHSSLFKAGRIAESLNEHRAIVQAISQRASQEAVLAVKKHFANGLAAAT